MRHSMASKLTFLVIFSTLCVPVSAVQLPDYSHVGPVGPLGPYKDPSEGATTCILHHQVSASHSLHSAVDVTWKVQLAFTQLSWVIDQAFFVTEVLFLLWVMCIGICTTTFFVLSAVTAKIQPYPPFRLLQGISSK